MNWVLDNKTWIFSGVGCLALGGLVKAVVWLLRRRAQTPTPGDVSATAITSSSMIGSPVATGSNISQNVSINIVKQTPPTPDGYSPRPTPQEIFAQLSKIPVFQQGDAARAYVGIKVRWRGTFEAMDEVQRYDVTDEGATHFVFLATGHSLIKVPVDIEQLPRLKVTHTGVPMEVRGTIVRAGPAILLNNATLAFVDD
jgi:hypothetical protein